MILNFKQYSLLEKFGSSIIREINDKFKKQTGKDLYSTMKHARINLDEVTDDDIQKGRGKLSNYMDNSKENKTLSIQIGMIDDEIIWVHDNGSFDLLYSEGSGNYNGIHTKFNDGKRKDYSDTVCDIVEISYKSNIKKTLGRTGVEDKERTASKMREDNLDFRKITAMIKNDESMYDRRYSKVNLLFRSEPTNEKEFLKFMNDHLEPTFKSYADVKRMFREWNIQMKQTWFHDKENVTLTDGCSIYQWLYIMPKMKKFFE